MLEADYPLLCISLNKCIKSMKTVLLFVRCIKMYVDFIAPAITIPYFQWMFCYPIHDAFCDLVIKRI